MDNLISKRNIFVFLFLAIIAVAIPVSLKLVQSQTQLKSKASEIMESAPVGPYPCNRPEQLQINGIAGKCNKPPDNNGCYKTAYVTWLYTTVGQNGPQGGDSADPNNQPWCDSSGCSDAYNQCPAAPAGPPALSGSFALASSSITYGGTISGTVTANSMPWRVSLCNDPGRSNCSATSNNWTQLGSGTGNGNFSYGPANTTGTFIVALLDPSTNAIVNQTAIAINPAATGGESCPVGTTYTISGAVRDSGNLVRSRDIMACLDPPENGCSSNAVVLTDGTYSIPNVRPGGAHNVYIDVSKVSGQYQQPEAKLVDKEVTNCSTNLTVDFILQKNSCPVGSTFTISGKVTNNNQPIVGAKVCLDPGTDGTCSGKTTFTTDSSGNYTIPNVVPGGQGHNIYLDPTSMPSIQIVPLPPIPNNPQLVAGSVCANTTVNFALGSQAGGGLRTKCYILSEDAGAVNSATTCTSSPSITQPYTGSITLPRSFTAAGTKTFSVRFISTLDVPSRVFSQTITYNPAAAASTAPTITNVSCQQNLITITGTNFGNQGTGRVTANSQPTTIGTWNSASNTITATPTQLLDGNVPIVITLGNNQTVSGQCTVNTTTVAFTAVNSCRQPGNFAAENVSAKIYDVTSTDANGTPLVERTISLDKNGKPVNFAPKLSQGKQYTLIVKAPNTIARAKTFTPTGGTYNLPVIILPAGDIYPLVAPDGHINQFDINELKRQWTIGVDVSRLGDLNGDSRVNSIDYSCAINNNTLQDDIFTPATLPTAAAGAAASTSPTITTIAPVNALISTAVTITGVNFGAVTTGTVNFYAASATSPTATAGVNSWTDTQITATIPGALTPSTQYSIEVVTAAGVKSAKTNYFVGP